MNTKYNKYLNDYLKKGFCIVNFPNIKVIIKVRELIRKKLVSITKNKEITLENYHKFVDDKNHEKFQWDICNFLENELC